MAIDAKAEAVESLDALNRPEGEEPPEVENQILDMVSQLRESIENRDLSSLSLLLADTPLWLYDRPGTFDDFHSGLMRLTKDSEDMEFFILKITSAEFGEDKACLSAETQLLWTDEKTWEEDEINSMMHMGFVKSDKGWKVAYLGFTARQVPVSSSLPQMAGSGVESSYFRLPEDSAWPVTYFGMTSSPPMFSNPFQGASSYFATSNYVYQQDDEILPLVPVYIPEFVLTDMMKKLMKK